MFKKILKPFSFIPALIMMYFIFSFSGQPGEVSGSLSLKVSHKIIAVGDKILNTNLDSMQINDYAEKIHTPVRKAAHMTEYFLLTIAVAFPLSLYRVRDIRLILFAGIFCVAFACSDEFHQSFVSNRGPSIKDVGIDSIGILIASIVIRLFDKFKSRQ